jgi:hypothetical protein
MWTKILVLWLGLNVAVASFVLLRQAVRRVRLRQQTSFRLADLVTWANENIHGAGFTRAKVLSEEQERFVVAVIKPLPPRTKGTPPYCVCQVSKRKDNQSRISEIAKAGYGIGIK